ncbi:unnamed protein product [Macrosiphum euphorbiae]|uniref:Integrase catalytic domain-containing protein n=1 Tax=Macrosiphum euphorbiae TaxID=13131 RepID=A0AAV0XH12_9HEMI|nr:unnamed protein product [Macrosiphum euphorbiae]
MEDVPTLTIRRGAIKGRITKFLKFLQDFTDDGDVSQIRVRKQKIEECWDEFQKIQSAIEIKVEDEAQATAEENYRFEFEDMYFQAIADSEKILIKTGHNANPNISNNSNGEVQGSTNSCNHLASIVKLAPLKIPEFSGNYKDWSAFKDIFTIMVHSNENVQEVQKLFYLKAALSGDAAEVVKCFETSANNYQIAWECLNERFNNKRIMVQAHIKAIFDLEKITEESSEKLRQFVDKLFGHIKALEAIGYTPMSWGPMLLHVISTKLDNTTLREWETQAPKTEVPKVEELIAFLKSRFQVLESIENAQSLNKTTNGPSQMPIRDNKIKNKNKTLFTHSATVKFKCYICEEPHAIYKCKQFLDLAVKQRRENVTKLKLCINCLSKHKDNKCKAKGCRKCGEHHNTLLHENVSEQNAETVPPTSISAHAAASAPGAKVLLSTAIIKIFSSTNEPFFARALLDSASQGNFITNNLVCKLRLAKHKFDCAISGVNAAECRVSHVVTAEVRARTNEYTRSINFMTLPKITSKLPTSPIHVSNSYTVPEYIEFADPTYATPGEIDLLLGAEVFFDTLRSGQYKPTANGLVYQETAFGWVVAGSVQQHSSNSGHTFVAQTLPSDCCRQIEKQISKFWHLEELGKVECFSLEEKQCIEHFEKSVTKGADGRFIVQLPFKENPNELGNSKAVALKRFMSTENRLRINPKLKEAYVQFINEYVKLGHMEQVRDNDENNKPVYYIPHHAVLRDNSLTTKLRVVFDASCITDTGKSLNDILLKGPSIQDDLISIITRFRTHKYAMSADIEKMYRQIWIAKKDRDFQRVLWRANPEDEVKEYRLNTVTYGTSPASYLATACLKKLADDMRPLFPDASSAVTTDFYMDDYLGGAQTIDAAVKLRNEIVAITNSSGFNLRKWVSNDKRLLTGIPNDDDDPLRVLNLDGSAVKTLGMSWNPCNDTYTYKFEKVNNDKVITKRTVLSAIATIFDPLSLIGPVVVKAKIFMQQLWTNKIGWDEKLPPPLYVEWNTYYEELPEIEQIRIPRCVMGVNNALHIQIHGFADASIKAYAAAMYLRATDEYGNHVTRLIAAKSRVAPLKVISLAKLELCAAVLLVRLVNKILPSLRVNCVRRYFWSDSTIVLAWISSPASKWKTFVAHRVGEVQQFSAVTEWAHVKSEDNPADVLSRGCSPKQLREHKLWWEGPQWLQADENSWPNAKEKVPLPPEEMPEFKGERPVVLTTKVEYGLIEKYSCLQKLLRITAYCMRWKTYNSKNKHFTAEINTEELDAAKNVLIKLVQGQYFHDEIKCLIAKQNVNKRSKLKLLCPYIDKDGILRVGGRLNNMQSINADKRNPVLLPAQSKLTILIFMHEHYRQIHVGPQALLATIRDQYWPLNGRNIARSVVNKCVICFKTKPFTFQPVMGDLPKARMQPGRAFATTGMDFAGPIKIKTSARRNAPILKAYICVFVCFATKAVHIELVSDLSTDAFLAALRRFWSRRGYCTTLWSDNGKNFVGANRKLKELCDLFGSKEHQAKVQRCVTEVGINWKFIPVYSPHFGGLWESAVKSIKHHLVRQLGSTALTFEELYTVLNRIEACLNSRPLSPLSSDPSDLNVLTPGHFLVGGSLTCLPDKDVANVPTNRLRRWQLVTQLTQQIWQRWSREYLSQLQGRTKWSSKNGPSVKKDLLVVIREPNLAPTQWRLGRIIELHPGQDDVIRVVTVRTERGQSKQAVRNLCPLPLDD